MSAATDPPKSPDGSRLKVMALMLCSIDVFRISLFALEELICFYQIARSHHDQHMHICYIRHLRLSAGVSFVSLHLDKASPHRCWLKHSVPLATHHYTKPAWLTVPSHHHAKTAWLKVILPEYHAKTAWLTVPVPGCHHAMTVWHCVPLSGLHRVKTAWPMDTVGVRMCLHL